MVRAFYLVLLLLIFTKADPANERMSDINSDQISNSSLGKASIEKTPPFISGHVTDHAGPRRYEFNPAVFQIVTRGISHFVLKLHNPMKICVSR